MENEKNHIIPYRTFLYVLLLLITLTLTSVTLTQIYLGTLTVVLALLIATIKSSFVLGIFMHLKFENKMFSIVVIAVMLLISAVIIITFLDYLYR
jgi:cytochrome c oxidase subunit 4